MAYEVTATIGVSDNTDTGALVNVGESETIGVVPWPEGMTPDEFVIATFEAMREQVDTALAALRVKALGQIEAHIEQLQAGCHPLQRMP